MSSYHHEGFENRGINTFTQMTTFLHPSSLPLKTLCAPEYAYAEVRLSTEWDQVRVDKNDIWGLSEENACEQNKIKSLVQNTSPLVQFSFVTLPYGGGNILIEYSKNEGCSGAPGS